MTYLTGAHLRQYWSNITSTNFRFRPEAGPRYRLTYKSRGRGGFANLLGYRSTSVVEGGEFLTVACAGASPTEFNR